MTWWMEKNKYNNIWFSWPNIVIEWEWRGNHILANIFSKNRVGVQKCQILSPTPISGKLFCDVKVSATKIQNDRNRSTSKTRKIWSQNLFIIYDHISNNMQMSKWFLSDITEIQHHTATNQLRHFLWAQKLAVKN